jgi:hypothetical protein
MPVPIINKDTNNNNLNILKMMQKPSNRLYIHSSHCQFEILIDDMPLNSLWGKVTENGAGISSDNLLNPFILKSGEHVIRVKIYPRFGQIALESYSYFQLEAYAVDAATYDFDEKIVFLTMNTPNDVGEPGQKKNPLAGLPYYEMRAVVKLEVPFELEGWHNSVDLKEENEKNEKIYQEVLQAYGEVYNAIKNKDFNTFKSMIEERENLLATTFYYNDQQKQNRWQSFVNELNNNEYELAPLPKEAILHFYGTGKIVTLLDSEREGIIKLVNKKNPLTDRTIFDFRFHRKTKGGKLTII